MWNCVAKKTFLNDWICFKEGDIEGWISWKSLNNETCLSCLRHWGSNVHLHFDACNWNQFLQSILKVLHQKPGTFSGNCCFHIHLWFWPNLYNPATQGVMDTAETEKYPELKMCYIFLQNWWKQPQDPQTASFAVFHHVDFLFQNLFFFKFLIAS